MIYSRENLPTIGEFIEVDIPWISKRCGSTVVGYFRGLYDEGIEISDQPNGGDIERIPWVSIIEIRSSASPNICIYIT